MPEPHHVVVELDQVVEAARAAGDQWREFLRAGMFSAGVYRPPRGKSIVRRRTPRTRSTTCAQGVPSSNSRGKRQAVEPGSIAFVTKLAGHRFVDIVEDLELLVIFAPPETAP